MLMTSSYWMKNYQFINLKQNNSVFFSFKLYMRFNLFILIKALMSLETYFRGEKTQHYFTFINICSILTAAPVEIDGTITMKNLLKTTQNLNAMNKSQKGLP
mgnify:CR=1 FL=1